MQWAGTISSYSFLLRENHSYSGVSCQRKACIRPAASVRQQLPPQAYGTCQAETCLNLPS